MQYFIQPPMRCTKYQNSEYSYRDTYAFPSETFLNTQKERIYIPTTVQEFDNFTQRENAVSLVFFANQHDPEMNRVLGLLAPLATNVHKLVLVDVSTLPELGQKYEVDQPKLIKIYKGHPVRVFREQFTEDCLRNFVDNPSTARWRQPNIR